MKPHSPRQSRRQYDPTLHARLLNPAARRLFISFVSRTGTTYIGKTKLFLGGLIGFDYGSTHSDEIDSLQKVTAVCPAVDLTEPSDDFFSNSFAVPTNSGVASVEKLSLRVCQLVKSTSETSPLVGVR